MMIKYGTSEVWKHTKTGELKEIKPGEKLDLNFWERCETEEEKLAEERLEGVVDV